MSMEHLYWDDGEESEDGSFVETLIEVPRPKPDQRPPYMRTDTEDFPETISPPLLFADTNENNNAFDVETLKKQDVLPWPQMPVTSSCQPVPEGSLSCNNFVVLCGTCACSLHGRTFTRP